MMQGSKGFTIVELVVCIALVSVLAMAALPAIQVQQQRQKERELRRALVEIRGAIDAYKKATDDGKLQKLATESGYPKSLEDLVLGIQNTKELDAQSPPLKFIRRIPRDPMGVGAEPIKWGLRSYASSHEEPKAGADVFDVYSVSSGVGLNGVPYREW